jgi:hypothetical protein
VKACDIFPASTIVHAAIILGGRFLTRVLGPRPVCPLSSPVSLATSRTYCRGRRNGTRGAKTTALGKHSSNGNGLRSCCTLSVSR